LRRTTGDFGGFLASSDRAGFLPRKVMEYRNFFHFGRAAPTPVSQPFESHYVFNDLQSELRRYTEAELLVYQGYPDFAELVIQH
jgi:hypothetical protein